MDLLTQIKEAMPGLPPDLAEEIIQEVAVLVLEGTISTDNLRADICRHLPALKRKYPSLQFQISLDAPVNNSEGTTMTLGDLIHRGGRLAKRRGKRIGRPIQHIVKQSICIHCKQRFYWKHYARKQFNKTQTKRLSLLPHISPHFWTAEDIDLLRRGNPQLLGESGKAKSGRTGRFCSRTCLTAFYREKRRKLPDRTTLIDLYLKRGLSTCKIQKLYGVTDPATVRKALLKYGVKLRSGKNTRPKFCKIDGCERPVHRIKHAGNGAEYGTLCKRHWAAHRATLNRWQRRKDDNIPPEKWRYQNEVPGFGLTLLASPL